MSVTHGVPVPAALKTKPHFDVLDGLRGVAAVVVVIFHFMEFAVPDYAKSFVGHGFLAVDFFFCLSGFVIGYAYDDRMARVGVWPFLEARLIRLHPMVVFGSVLGLAMSFVDPFAPVPHFGVLRMLRVFVASVLLIPYPVMPEREFNLFSLNAPAWSLFWEYAANLVYAVGVWRLRRRPLLVLVLVAAGLLGWVVFLRKTMGVGWGGPTPYDGWARVLFSFFAGLLVYRMRWMIPNRLGFWGVSVLLLGALMMPYFGQPWAVELVLVVVYLPLLVALGAGTTLTRSTERICVWSGRISYPLYMTHYWAIWIFASYLHRRHPPMGQVAVVIACSVTLLLGLAWAVLVLYDEPVRRWLRVWRAGTLLRRAAARESGARG